MFPKKGKKFPSGNSRGNNKPRYVEIIATTLRTELGGTHRAVKTIMRWTGASERTVKHWLSGLHGPSGDHLLVLMRESEAVFESVLTAAGRRDAVVAARMLQAHGTMVDMMAMVEHVARRPAQIAESGVRAQGGASAASSNELENDRINDRVNPRSKDGLNHRQRWYIDVLASGAEARAKDLQRRWDVSETTARRDLEALKARGIVEFIGPFKTGRYRLNC